MFNLCTYILLLVCSLIAPSVSYVITVDAHAEECFFDKVESGTKMGNSSAKYFLCKNQFLVVLTGLTFEIAEGGFLDIDVRIIGPDGRTIYQGERESSGKYTFAAHNSGAYTYCFSNKMSTMTPKVVMFSMSIGESQKPEAAQEGENANKLEDMIKELSSK